jgi:DNA-binding transcriptional MerR regulator
MSAGAILKLQSVGFSAEQVGALAELIDSQSATKPDLEATEHRLESKIEAVEHRLELKIEALRTQIAESEATLIRWFVLTAVAAVIIGAAVAGFIFKPIP